jgi:hypothetical protein
MTSLTIAGGIYHERCTWPEWNHTYGSGGRAAAAVAGHLDNVQLYSYVPPLAAKNFRPYAEMYGFDFREVEGKQLVSFDYVHSLSNPIIRPIIGRIQQNDAIPVAAEAVLRFGMLEGSARITAQRCVYDPQSAFDPEPFEANGSRAEALAIVANRAEIAGMSGASDPLEGAKILIERGAQLVVVKSGAEGAFVVSGDGIERVPAFQSERVWTIGSGDVFAAVFAARWAALHDVPLEAAQLASRAVASYAETMALPVPPWEELASANRKETVSIPGQVYLASPFFTLGERWVVEEARRGLKELGLEVFSPLHEIGPGVAEVVAPADIAGIDASDRVFAILHGTDSGTLFEVGYAVAKGIPVYALAQNVSEEDLKMVQGSGCRVYGDFVTALHHTAWRL